MRPPKDLFVSHVIDISTIQDESRYLLYLDIDGLEQSVWRDLWIQILQTMRWYSTPVAAGHSAEGMARRVWPGDEILVPAQYKERVSMYRIAILKIRWSVVSMGIPIMIKCIHIEAVGR